MVVESVEGKPAFQYKGRGIFIPRIDIKDYLFWLVSTKGPISRGDLVEATGIPRSTIYDTLVKLILDERIRKFSVSSNRRGRPRVYYEVKTR